jgi:hypothetical protein
MYATLEQLLDSHTRAKLLKLFYRNVEKKFYFTEIVDRTQSKPKDVKTELKRLETMKLLKKRTYDGRLAYSVYTESDYSEIIANLVSGMGTIPFEVLTKLIKTLGSVKLALVSGIFLKLPYAKADLLIVGEGFSKIKLKNFLKRLEAETGKEIDYVLMSVDEYNYRVGMFDRFILDLKDKPHKVLIDKFSVNQKFNEEDEREYKKDRSKKN